MNRASAALGVIALGLGIALGVLMAGPGGFGQGTPTPSLEAALLEENLLIRSQMLGRFLDTLGPTNLEEALEGLHANRVGVTDQELRVFMLAWGRFDAPGAFQWAQAQDSDWSGRLKNAALYGWGFRDPHAAVAELETLPPSGGRQGSPLLTELMSGWRVNGDVDGLTAHLIAMPSVRQRETMTSHLLAQIGKAGPEAVIAWANAIPENAPRGFKRIAFNRGVSTVAKVDPRLGARWFEENREKDFSEGSLGVIARRWIDHHQPADFFVWLGGLPPLPDQSVDAELSGATGQAMKWWLRRDSDAALGWLNSQDSIPPEYDPAVASLAQFLLKKTPDLAVYWADRIQDPELRSSTLIKSLGRWRRRDPAAADEWIATAELTDAVREQALKTGTGRPKSRPQRPRRP
ncbi:MAG TPA: hypothetical protein EYQ54_08145 [Myxococcales bacterium]|nr:hypothetical protein [Myxococcales bacterium]